MREFMCTVVLLTACTLRYLGTCTGRALTPLIRHHPASLGPAR